MATAEHQPLRDRHNKLCTEIFDSCIDKDSPCNTVVGVNSIIRNLHLQYLGAGAKTREEIDPTDFGYISLPQHSNLEEGGLLSFSNIFYPAKYGMLSEEYNASLPVGSVYHSPVTPTTLEAEHRKSSEWLRHVSDGQITECITLEEMSSIKVSYITNSTFCGHWVVPFNTGRDTGYHRYSTLTTLMYAHARCVSVSNLEDKYKAVIASFPYTNGCSLLVAMPRHDSSYPALFDLIQEISRDFTAILLSLQCVGSSSQAIPKFSTTTSLHLTDTLQNVEKLRPLVTSPDMSGMFSHKPFLYEGLSHRNKTSIINNELGTVTESTTITDFFEYDRPSRDPPRRSVTIDGPCVYYTLDNTDAIVDIGIFLGGGGISDNDSGSDYDY